MSDLAREVQQVLDSIPYYKKKQKEYNLKRKLKTTKSKRLNLNNFKEKIERNICDNDKLSNNDSLNSKNNSSLINAEFSSDQSKNQ
jgi:hypothetical protein